MFNRITKKLDNVFTHSFLAKVFDLKNLKINWWRWNLSADDILFLVKNLLIHWLEGEKWFWDCLVDADLASNSAGWQWVAGSGADAAPYFRFFNPITQGLKFDSEGNYTKKYVPELKNLPIKYLFSPWEAPEEVLNSCNIVLGKDYPEPIVDLKISRDQALKAFDTTKKAD